MPSCSTAAGFQGFMKANGYVMPFLSADLTKVQELIPSNSIHGGGFGAINPVFNSAINFAEGRILAEGNVSCEVFGGSGNFAQAFTEMITRAIPTQTDYTNVCAGFTTGSPLIFSPGGGYEIVLPSSVVGKCVLASVNIAGNPGGNVRCDFSVKSAGADNNNTAAHAPAASDLSFETAGSTDDNNPIPYYASNFSVTGSGESSISNRITDWNLSVNNNANYVYVFNGSAEAIDIIIGMREVTGTFSYYSSDGTFVQDLTHGAAATVSFGSHTLTMPFLGFGRAPIPSPSANNFVVRTVNFTGFAASSTQPSIYYS